MTFRLHFFLLGTLLWGCGGSASSPPGKTNRYFDLESYFQNEISRLNSEQPVVEKTVSNNREKEERTIKQLDWAVELGLFRNSGINKPSWRDSYTIDSSARRLSYQATDPGLRVRGIDITKNNQGKITGIVIRREVNNYLYKSAETLQYYPDSLYHIERRQKVRVLGEAHFEIRGSFSPGS